MPADPAAAPGAAAPAPARLLGVRFDPDTRHDVGWSVLVEAVIEHAAVGAEDAPLVHRRGRYQRPGD